MKNVFYVFSNTAVDSASNPLPTKLGGTISISANQLVAVAIQAPTEGSVRKLVVEQVTGTASTGTVDLLNSGFPFPGAVPGTPASFAHGTAPANSMVEDLYRIIPQQTIASSKVVYSSDYGTGYRSADCDATNLKRLIYLIIDPNVNGVTTWDVSILIRAETSQ